MNPLDLFPYTHTPDGVKRCLGLVPSKRVGDFIPPAPAAPAGAIIPASELVAFDSWPAPLKVLDQQTWNACTYFSSAQALMFARFESGQPHVDLDPLFPYLHVTRGQNIGTNILQASQVLAQDGMPPLGMSKRHDAPQQAKRFCIELSASLTSYAELLSEAARRRPMVGSIYVGSNYHQLDADGAMGVQRGTANHAIFLGGGLKFSTAHGWMIKHCGSWGPRWGQGGFGWYTEAHFDAAGFGEAYTVEGVIEDLQDDDNPPKVTE